MHTTVSRAISFFFCLFIQNNKLQAQIQLQTWIDMIIQIVIGGECEHGVKPRAIGQTNDITLQQTYDITANL